MLALPRKLYDDARLNDQLLVIRDSAAGDHVRDAGSKRECAVLLTVRVVIPIADRPMETSEEWPMHSPFRRPMLASSQQNDLPHLGEPPGPHPHQVNAAGHGRST